MSRLLSSILMLGVLLLGLTLSSAGISWEDMQAAHAVQHVQTVLKQELNLLSACQEVDMLSRGYALTKDSKFASRYVEALKSLQDINRTLKFKDLIAGDQNQSELLGSELDDAIAQLIRTSQTLKNSSKDAEQAALGQQAAMDKLRTVIASIMNDETLLLQQRRIKAAVQEEYLWVAIGIELLAGMGLIIAMKHALTRYDRETEDKLRILREAADQSQQARSMAEEALQTKNCFLATVSHEVRTPMVGIIGLAELLSLQDLGADANSSVYLILDSSKRLLQILNNVLDAAKLHAGAIHLQPRLFPVRTLIGDVTQLISPEARKRNITVSAHCAPNVPEFVCGDEFRARQVLLNLGFNAVKFTEEGEVKVRAELPSAQKDGSTALIRFTVSDTGIGISAEQQEKLFQPFAQVHDSTSRVSGGTGLGLSISKDLVELMGGRIGVESQPGKGSSFWVEMPFKTSQEKIAA